MSRARLLRYAAIAAGAAVVVAVGVAAFLSLQTPYVAPVTSSGSAACTPKPCANVRGYIVWISDLKVDSGLVSMQLTFRNSSPATHADPADFGLIDSLGHPNPSIYDAPGCTRWSRTDFNNGAQFGPVSECFRPSSTGPPLKLHWTPDMGLFCCETDITLSS